MIELLNRAALRRGKRMDAVLHHFGLTLILGLAGAVALVFGKRRLAGALWFSLGSGAVGVTFDQITNNTLRFDNLHRPDQDDIGFLVYHLPFLALGILLLMGIGTSHE